MSALPVAQVVEVLPPERAGESWLVVVECPFCVRGHRGRRGEHVHAIMDDDADTPLLLSRESDCGGGAYEVGPLPANFAELVRTRSGWRR